MRRYDLGKVLSQGLYLCLLFSLAGCNDTQPRAHTAAKNVVILETKLAMPGLQRNRQLRLYLPPDYDQSNNTYPVIYLHDGQNLFDDATSYAGEWRIDESLNEIFARTGQGFIAVGIDNGGDKRMSELSPWTNADYAQAEGEQYLDFIVKVVKPFIDATYRTKKEAENTAIMGSSMGGLMSHYGLFKYPEIFSKAGIYSPSYWYSDAVYPYSQSRLPKLEGEHRIYFLAGVKEGEDMVDNLRKMVDLIKNNKVRPINYVVTIDPEGDHNEAFWAKHFTDSVRYLFQIKTLEQ